MILHFTIKILQILDFNFATLNPQDSFVNWDGMIDNGSF